MNILPLQEAKEKFPIKFKPGKGKYRNVDYSFKANEEFFEYICNLMMEGYSDFAIKKHMECLFDDEYKEMPERFLKKIYEHMMNAERDTPLEVHRLITGLTYKHLAKKLKEIGDYKGAILALDRFTNLYGIEKPKEIKLTLEQKPIQSLTIKEIEAMLDDNKLLQPAKKDPNDITQLLLDAKSHNANEEKEN